MFRTIVTLFDGANARAEERVRKTYSIELIDQKIREGSAGLKAAKITLAGIIQRQRTEERQVEALDARIKDLTARALEALEAGRDDLAGEAAEAIARLENERNMRAETAERMETQALRLRTKVETVNRRLVDLRQGAIAAKAARQEGRIHRKLSNTMAGQDALSEADELIRNVLGEDDPFEQSEILSEIDAGLEGTDIAGRMSDAGFGKADKANKDSVLERLKAQKKSK